MLGQYSLWRFTLTTQFSNTRKFNLKLEKLFHQALEVRSNGHIIVMAIDIK